MKYKRTHFVYEIRPSAKGGKDGFRIKRTCMKTGHTDYLSSVYETLDEAKKAVEVYESHSACDGANVSEFKFRSFYGCDDCADSRDSNLNREGHIRYCIHKECPYAEEIEKAGGWKAYLKQKNNINIDALFGGEGYL